MTATSGRSRRTFSGAILVLLAATGACTLLPPRTPAPTSTFLLRPGSPSAAGSPAECREGAGTLQIGVSSEAPGFDTSRMAYLLRPHSVRYYARSRWADTPARMLAPVLVEALEKTGCWHAVVGSPSAIPADFRLDAEDLVLEQQFFSRPSKVRLALRATLVDLRGSAVVAERRFEALEDAPSEDAEGGAIAAGRAAAKLVGALSAWANGAARAVGPGR